MAEMPQDHADQVRAALRTIVDDPEYGPAALSSPQLIANLLRDYLPEAPLEKNLLIAAAEEGLADRLRDHAIPGADISAVMRAIETSFRNRRGLTVGNPATEGLPSGRCCGGTVWMRSLMVVYLW